jgi:hypothetical protein
MARLSASPCLNAALATIEQFATLDQSCRPSSSRMAGSASRNRAPPRAAREREWERGCRITTRSW